MTLRPYQRRQADAALKTLRSGRRGSIVMATGTGKTRTAAYVVEHFRRSALWLTDQRALVEQTQPRTSATVATIQSKPTGFYGLVVVDEAHNFLTPRRLEFIDSLDCPVLALTATPRRGDGKSIFEHFGPPVSDPYAIGDAIADGYLCDVRALAVDITGVNLLGVKTRGEDFDTESLARVMNQPDVNEEVVARWRELGQGLTNFYAVNRAHADALAEEVVRQTGLRCVSIHRGHKDADDRLRALRAGELDAVTSVQLIAEGFDHPPLQTGVNCRPMRSDRLLVQALGRFLRPHPGKERALWIDAGGSLEAVDLASLYDVVSYRPSEPRTLTGGERKRPADALLSDIASEVRSLDVFGRAQALGFHRLSPDDTLGPEAEVIVLDARSVMAVTPVFDGCAVTILTRDGHKTVGDWPVPEAEAWGIAYRYLEGRRCGAAKDETKRLARDIYRHIRRPSKEQRHWLTSRELEVPKSYMDATKAQRRWYAMQRTR